MPPQHSAASGKLLSCTDQSNTCLSRWMPLTQKSTTQVRETFGAPPGALSSLHLDQSLLIKPSCVQYLKLRRTNVHGSTASATRGTGIAPCFRC